MNYNVQIKLLSGDWENEICWIDSIEKAIDYRNNKLDELHAEGNDAALRIVRVDNDGNIIHGMPEMKKPTIEWSYTKLAYMLDVEEVIWPMCEAVRRANIWTPEQLVEAVLLGDIRMWPKVTKKGLKGLFKVLRNQCKVDNKTLFEAAKLYT